MDTKEIEKKLKQLKTDYKTVFNTDEGQRVLSDLEKRCHFLTTTNIKGDSHESAYMEGQRSVLLFIKTNAANQRKHNVKRTDNTGNCACRKDIYRSTTTSNTNNCC